MKQHKQAIEYRVYDLPVSFPIIVLSGDHWRISDIRSRRLHFHNCLEVGICRTDSGIMEFENKPMPFHAGDVTVVSRNILHTTYSSPGEKSLWTYIFFQPKRLIPPYLQQSLEATELFSEIEQSICHIFNGTEYPQIYFYANKIAEDLTAKPANYQAGVRALCALLMIELMRIHSDKPIYGHARAAEKALVLAPALDFLHNNYSQQFPIDMLADLCHLSPTHFRRLFGEIMRCTPLEFLHRTRVTEARGLLRGTELTVLEVSERVGYLSISSFNRHFLQETGTSPTEWRHSSFSLSKHDASTYNGWMLPEQLKK